MISSFNTMIGNVVDKCGHAPVIATAIGVGFLAYPLLSKIASVAFDAIYNLIQRIKESVISYRLRSMACEECAETHKAHVLGVENINGQSQSS